MDEQLKRLKKQIEDNLFLELDTRMQKYEKRLLKIEQDLDEIKKI